MPIRLVSAISSRPYPEGVARHGEHDSCSVWMRRTPAVRVHRSTNRKRCEADVRRVPRLRTQWIRVRVPEAPRVHAFRNDIPERAWI
jgi:hypothetical protein